MNGMGEIRSTGCGTTYILLCELHSDGEPIHL